MNKMFNLVFQLNQKRLHGFLVRYLERHYGKENVFTSRDNFVVARGTTPLMLVAHLDTVHRVSNRGYVFYDPIKKVAWSPSGLGADDRAGVYAILELVKNGYRPHIAFTHDEEIGGLGANTLASYNIPFELKFMVELDRRGWNDAVFYDCGNKEFQKKILSFGFKEAFGSFSDISILSPAFDVASVNLSIGYYSEHTTHETLCTDEMYDTIVKVSNIIDWVEEDKSVPVYDYQEDDYWPSSSAVSRGYYGKGKSYDYNTWDYKGEGKASGSVYSAYASAYGYDNPKELHKDNIEEYPTSSIKSILEDSDENIEDEMLSKMGIKDFDYDERKDWTPKMFDRYFELLYYKDFEDEWTEEEKKIAQKYFLTDDAVSEEMVTVNEFLKHNVG